MSWATGDRPITLAVLAMGGEGGGVLSDWLLDVAARSGYTSQNTSVAGVAQRTGATVYYVEMFPPRPAAEASGEGPVTEAGLGRPEPVLGLFPTPGEVDIVIASELMECGRAVQRGFATPDRTVLITSTNRVYSMTERISLGDGRVDSQALIDSARRASRRFIAADFMTIAEQAHSVISASLFGALAGSGALPFPTADFEAAIRGAGRGVETSVAAFRAGFEAAVTSPEVEGPRDEQAGSGSTQVGPPGPGQTPARAAPVPVSIGRRPQSPEEQKAVEEAALRRRAIDAPESLVGPLLHGRARRVAAHVPAAARSMALLGLVRTAMYQDLAYADRFLERLDRVVRLDPDPDGEAALSREAARHIALWMCYQDTIQVARQKTRRARLARVREEARAGEEQLVEIREFLHPQVEELSDTMPTALGRALRHNRVFAKAVDAVGGRGIVVNTTSVWGYTTLTALGGLRRMRPRTLRFGTEQELIDAWIDHVVAEAEKGDPGLAREILECQRVLKGYGQTHERGAKSFERLMRAGWSLSGRPDAADTLRSLREAALADEDGSALTARLHEVGAADRDALVAGAS